MNAWFLLVPLAGLILGGVRLWMTLREGSTFFSEPPESETEEVLRQEVAGAVAETTQHVARLSVRLEAVCELLAILNRTVAALAAQPTPVGSGVNGGAGAHSPVDSPASGTPHENAR